MKKTELRKMIREELLTEKKLTTTQEMMDQISYEGLYVLWLFLPDWDEMISTSTDPKEIKALKNLKRILPQVSKDLNILYKKYYGEKLT